MRSILILGATSGMAQEASKLFAADGDKLFLVARDKERLSAVRSDLLVRGAHAVETWVGDLSQTEHHAALIDRAEAVLGRIDVALIAYGDLGDQKKCEESFQATAIHLHTNFLSAVSLLTLLANRFESARAGTIAVITSVAGDRGRKSNYVYGTAKGALSIFLQGVRNRLNSSGVTVVTIKPGFVDTPMTRHLKQGALFVSAQVAGKGIYDAIINKRDIAYVPWFWRYIMLLIRHIPERFFKRLNL